MLTREREIEIETVAVDVLCDFGLSHYPVSIREVAEALGIKLVPYSSLSATEKKNLPLPHQMMPSMPDPGIFRKPASCLTILQEPTSTGLAFPGATSLVTYSSSIGKTRPTARKRRTTSQGIFLLRIP